MKPYEQARYASLICILGFILITSHIDFHEWNTWAGILGFAIGAWWLVRTILHLKFARDGAFWQNVFGNPHPSEPEMRMYENWAENEYLKVKRERRRMQAMNGAARFTQAHGMRAGFHSDTHRHQDDTMYSDQTKQW